MLINRLQRPVTARAAALLALGVATLGLAACATDATEGTSGGGGTTSDDVVTEAKANVDTWYANSSAPLETEGVVGNNLEGKRVFYLSDISVPSGAAGLAAMEQAQSALGFELKVFDGQYSVAKRQEGLREALAGNYDGVVTFGLDCAGNEQPLKDLRAADIPVASISGVDCDDPLFSADVVYPLADGQTGTAVGLYEAWGLSQADYVIAKTDGEAKVIYFEVPGYSVLRTEAKAFKDRLAQCGGCEVVKTVEVVDADFGGPSLAQKADQALLQHPEATAVVVPYDDLLTLGVANSVKRSGRANDLLVVGGNGLEAVVDMVREDAGVDGGFGYDFAWDHYAALAALMSAREGEPVPPVGQPVIYYDREHNLPEDGPWVPEVDFVSAFEDAWNAQ